MTVHWVGLVCGVWILLSPWLLGWSSISTILWSNTVAGVALILVNLWAIVGTKQS